MASFLFDTAIENIAKGVDWTALDARFLLLDSAGGAPVATQATVSAVLGTCTEATGFTNYTRKALASEAVTGSGADWIWTATSPSWTALGSIGDQLGGAVLFAQVTNDSDSWPIGFFEEADQELGGFDYELTITPSGLVGF